MDNEYNEILDYFHEKYGSKIWPSDDPNDSPFNTFTCKQCGYEFEYRVFGSFPIGTDHYAEAKKKILEHITTRHIR